MKLERRTSHELSHTTMAFMATEIEGSWGTKILLEGGDQPIFVDSPPDRLIRDAYRQHGEELIARFDGARILCGFKNKPPIAISMTNDYYFFPTHSPANPNCSWFSHSHIKKIKKARYGGSILHFKDGQKLTIPVSEGIMSNQLLKTAQYRFILEEEIKPMERRAAIEAILKILGYDI